MTAEIINIACADRGRAFSRCREVIRSGGVIVYPTDTFYGIGVDPKNPAAVKRLFEIKGRKADQPILLLIKNAADAAEWAADITPNADRLMKRYWPGPLTLVFEARPGVLPELTAGTGTIGLRVPGTELARELLRFLDIALTGTSANVSGGPSPRTASESMTSIGHIVDLILDGGATAGGLPSTVVDVRTDPPSVIRKGAVTL